MMSESCGDRLRVFNHLLRVRFELRLERLTEADRLGGNHMHERATLHAGEHLRVDFFRKLLFAENDATARAAQGFVRSGGDEIRMRHGAGMHACRDESGDVGHVDKQVGANLAGKFAHALEVNHARISRSADRDQCRPQIACGFFKFLVIESLVIGRYAVVGDIVESSRKVRLMAVREMAAVREIHREDFVAGFEH